MQELSINDLLEKKNQLNNDIKEIEEKYEGISNPLNIEKIQKLNKDQVILVAEKKKLLEKLSNIDAQLRRINTKVRTLSGEGIDVILDAISTQRWFFFKNRPKVVMDKFTGILWANLDYFEFYNPNNETHTFSLSEAIDITEALELDGFKNWSIPTATQMITMIDDKSFPFQEGNCHRIKNLDYWFAYDGNNFCIDLDNYNKGQANVYLIPCNTSLTSEEYAKNVLSDSRIYTETEKLQFTLNLFINNELEPVFRDEKISELYYKVYVEKPQLIKELEEVNKNIGYLQDNILISSVFDYSVLIRDYDLDKINSSVIQYYKAVQKWIDSFMDMLDFFEREKVSLVKNYDNVNEKLLTSYEFDLEMSEEENSLFEKRRGFLQKCLALNMNDTRVKLIKIRKQADNIELEIEKINDGENAIEELARLEKRDRASFELLAENTINIVKEMLEKAEYFEKNKRVLTSIINIEKSWADDYRMLKLKYKSKYKNICEREGIGSYTWSMWYREWCVKRFQIEQLFLPLIEREIKGSIKEKTTGMEEFVSVIEKIFNGIQLYKDNLDDFYTNNRKDIYNKYANLVNGEIQENLEVTKELTKLTDYLRGNLENTAANLVDEEDKIFIQRWIKPIATIRI